MRTSKKQMLANLDGRYKVIPVYDGYNLYDTTRKSQMMHGGAFVANIQINPKNGNYYWRDMVFTDVNVMSKAIDEYVDTLPFNCEFYDPTYRKNIFVELCCGEYLNRLGLKSNPFQRNGMKFECTNPMDGKPMFTIGVECFDDTTKGRVYKETGAYSWEEMYFDSLEGAIANINSMLSVDTLLNASTAVKILNGMSNIRAKNEWLKKVVNTETYEVYTKNLKDELIEKLEKELQELKNLK